MAVNQFEKPLQHNPQQTYISQYVPLPFDTMANKVKQDQAELDAAKNQAAKLSEAMTLDGLPVDDPIVAQKINQIQESVADAVTSAGGDYRKATGAISQGANEWKTFTEMGIGADVKYRLEKRNEYEKAVDESDVGDFWSRSLKRASSIVDAQSGGVLGLGRELITIQPWKVQDYRKIGIDMALKKRPDITDWTQDQDTGDYIITTGNRTERLTGEDVTTLAYNHLKTNEEFLNMVEGKYKTLSILSGEDGLTDVDGEPVSFDEYLEMNLQETLQGSEAYGYSKTKDVHRLKKTAVGDEKDIRALDLINLKHTTYGVFKPLSNTYQYVEGKSGKELTTAFYEKSKQPVENFWANVKNTSGEDANWTDIEANSNLAEVFKNYGNGEYEKDWSSPTAQAKLMEDIANGHYTWEDYNTGDTRYNSKDLLGSSEKEFLEFKERAEQHLLVQRNRLAIYDEIFEMLKNRDAFKPEQVAAWEKHREILEDPNIPAWQKPNFAPDMEKQPLTSDEMVSSLKGGLYLPEKPTEYDHLKAVWNEIGNTGEKMIQTRVKRYNEASTQKIVLQNYLPIIGEDAETASRNWQNFKRDMFAQASSYWENEAIWEAPDGSSITVRGLAEERVKESSKWRKIPQTKLGEVSIRRNYEKDIDEEMQKIINDQILFQDFYEPGSVDDLAMGIINYEDGKEKTYKYIISQDGDSKHVYSTLFDLIDGDSKNKMRTRTNNMEAELGLTEKREIDLGVYIKTANKPSAESVEAETTFPGDTKSSGVNARYGARSATKSYEFIINPKKLKVSSETKNSLKPFVNKRGVIEINKDAYRIERLRTINLFKQNGFIELAAGEETIRIDTKEELNDYIYGDLLIYYIK